MGRERSIYEEPDADAASEQRAADDVRQGRLIDHRFVKRWLQSWGQATRSPKPRIDD